MQECLNRIQTTINAVNDIEKAINEQGISTRGACLIEYGDLIRRISGAGSLYPDYATLILKTVTNVPTFVAEINNKDSYKGVFTPSIEQFFPDVNEVYHFTDDVLAVETYTAIKTDKNTKDGVFTKSIKNEIVEIVELE